MNQVINDALQLIGNTPLIALDRIYSGPGRLLAKVEFMQPGGSVKDRAALRIIKDAYQNGALKKGQPVIEMTSGNMGAGLAVICNLTGNRFTAVMSSGNSPARARILESLGAEVVLTPQIDGRPGYVTGADIKHAAEIAIQLAHERNGFYVDQFNAPGSVSAHEEGTGPEIWNVLDKRLDAFVAGVGSGGTFIGISRFLKSRNKKISCVPVEPEGAEILSGKSKVKAQHILQGMGYGFIPPHWDASLADSIISISDDEAIQYKNLLARREGLNVGFSAAANVCASIKLINQGLLGQSPTVVTILCDTGMKY